MNSIINRRLNNIMLMVKLKSKVITKTKVIITTMLTHKTMLTNKTIQTNKTMLIHNPMAITITSPIATPAVTIAKTVAYLKHHSATN